MSTGKALAAIIGPGNIGTDLLAKLRRSDVIEVGYMVGVVESDKCSQTRKVVVRYAAKHPKYGKFVRQRTVLHVHDESNQSKAGDTVEVEPCRPLSKSKTWRLVRVMNRGAEAPQAGEKSENPVVAPA